MKNYTETNKDAYATGLVSGNQPLFLIVDKL